MFNGEHITDIIRYIIFFICFLIGSGIVFYIIWRNSFKFKYDHHNKIIEYSQDKIMELQNNHIENALSENKVLEKFRGQSTENIIQHYDTVRFNDSITNWVAYKEGVQIISSTTLKIAYRIRRFITMNGLGTKTDTELEELSRKRANDIIGLYNLELKKSDIDVVNKLTLKKICGTYFYIIEMLLYRCYKDIGENHIKCIHNIKEKEALYIQENSKVNTQEKMKGLNEIRYEATHERNKLDDTISEQTLTKIQNIIIGIFHDMLVKE